MASTPAIFADKKVTILDMERFSSMWNTDLLVPTCDVRKTGTDGVAYSLSLYDVMQNKSKKVEIKLPAGNVGILRRHSSPLGYGDSFTLTDASLREHLEQIADVFATALQSKCSSRGVEPDYVISDFYKWPWASSSEEFMANLTPDDSIILILNGAYHKTKGGKNEVTLEWAVSQFPQRPMAPRVRKGKRPVSEISQADVPETEGM